MYIYMYIYIYKINVSALKMRREAFKCLGRNVS